MHYHYKRTKDFDKSLLNLVLFRLTNCHVNLDSLWYRCPLRIYHYTNTVSNINFWSQNYSNVNYQHIIQLSHFSIYKLHLINKQFFPWVNQNQYKALKFLEFTFHSDLNSNILVRIKHLYWVNVSNTEMYLIKKYQKYHIIWRYYMTYTYLYVLNKWWRYSLENVCLFICRLISLMSFSLV